MRPTTPRVVSRLTRRHQSTRWPGKGPWRARCRIRRTHSCGWPGPRESAENLGLLGGELLLGEDALVPQLGKLLELLDRVRGGLRRRCNVLRWRRSLLIGGLPFGGNLCIAVDVPLGLAPLHPAAHRGRGAGYHGGP